MTESGYKFTGKLDPKDILIKIWKTGGLYDKTLYVPAFVSREVQKRYTWIQSADMTMKLEELRAFQETVKTAEEGVRVNRDYDSVLNYLKKMNELRSREAEVRNYAIQEMEISRSREDSFHSCTEILMKNKRDCEHQYSRVISSLNEKLARTESLLQSSLLKSVQNTADLWRLVDITDSFIATERDRRKKGVKFTAIRPLKLRKPEESSISIRNLHSHLQNYRKVADTNEAELRDILHSACEEVRSLRATAKNLEDVLQQRVELEAEQTGAVARAEREIKFSAVKMSKMKVQNQTTVDEAWQSSLRYCCMNSLYLFVYFQKLSSI